MLSCELNAVSAGAADATLKHGKLLVLIESQLAWFHEHAIRKVTSRCGSPVSGRNQYDLFQLEQHRSRTSTRLRSIVKAETKTVSCRAALTSTAPAA